VAGLVHDAIQVGATLGSGRHEPGPQAMAAEILDGIAGGLDVALDDAGDVDRAMFKG